MVHLVGNAVTYTDRGQVVVSVTLLPSEGPDIRVRVDVRDTSEGIPPDLRATLFQRFSQAEAWATNRYGGTGLGLGIARDLVELMGGTMIVESTVGVGNDIGFAAPLRRAHRAVARRPERLVGRRALVVDDVEANLTILSTQLSYWGVVTTPVGDARAALEAARSAESMGAPFDVVITDYEMPGRNGLELADDISRELTAPPPVVILSSGAWREGGDRDLSKVSSLVTKPVRRSQLFAALTMAMTYDDTRTGTAQPDGSVPVASGTRILVADDNATNRALASKLLEKAGYQADVVDDGRAAVDAVRRGGYVAVLMDCEMPILNGYDAAMQIRREEPVASRIPIIALTANATRRDVQRVLEAGMDAHITKPVDRAELYRTITELVGDSSPAAKPASVRADAVSLNQQVLDQLKGVDGTGDTLGLMAGLFIQESVSRVEALERATIARNAEDVHQAAHALRGSAVTMGADRLAELMGEVEERGRGGLVPTPDDIERVRALIAAAVTELRHLARSAAARAPNATPQSLR
jgi:CheY-like chemotaxis protein